MDYGKSGSAKPSKQAPKHAEHNQKGSKQNPFGGKDEHTTAYERKRPEPLHTPREMWVGA